MPVATNASVRMERYLWPWSLGWMFAVVVNAPKTPIYWPMKTVLDYQSRDRKAELWVSTNHRPINIAQRSLTPKDYVYSQDNVTDYEEPYTKHI